MQIQKDPKLIEKLTKAANPIVNKIDIVPKGYLKPDPERSLLHAEFDTSNRLVLTFSDGKKLITRSVESNLNIDQYISVKAGSQGTTSDPSAIKVRFVSSNSVITDADDIVIVTAEATVVLPETSEKTFRIKRSGNGNVTIVPFSIAQTIEFNADLVINMNLFSVDLHYDGINNWVVL